MASAAGDVRQERAAARRPAAGIPIDPGYLEHLRVMRKLSRARLAELIGEALFDRELFDKVLDGAGPPDARTARVLAGLFETPAPGGGWVLDGLPLDKGLAGHGWTRDDLAGKVARAGRSRDNVAKWENGERNPKPDALGALCAVLSTDEHEVTVSELMTGTSPQSAAREAAARRAREDYYAGLRDFAVREGLRCADENGELFFSPELRRQYDKYLLNGSREGQLAS